VAIAGSVENAVKKAKASGLSKKIETEVTGIADTLKAAAAGADIIMLDNFSPKQVRQAVEALKNAGFFGKVLLEVSGGITEQNLLEYASAQVDIVSVGALTHSVKALDISLDVTAVK
jgi:nicotinate-nucleotide pyrophosphorylase (carboxylating)